MHCWPLAYHLHFVRTKVRCARCVLLMHSSVFSGVLFFFAFYPTGSSECWRVPESALLVSATHSIVPLYSFALTVDAGGAYILADLGEVLTIFLPSVLHQSLPNVRASIPAYRLAMLLPPPSISVSRSPISGVVTGVGTFARRSVWTGASTVRQPIVIIAHAAPHSPVTHYIAYPAMQV